MAGRYYSNKSFGDSSITYVEYSCDEGDSAKAVARTEAELQRLAGNSSAIESASIATLTALIAFSAVAF